jgi:hypothetical protein
MLINGPEFIKIAPERKSPTSMCSSGLNFLERETGLEPATSTLALIEIAVIMLASARHGS